MVTSQPGDEPVAQVAGGGVAQRCLGDQGAGGGADVVALLVGLLQHRRGGRPVALLEQSRVELAGERCPPLGRRLGGRGLEAGADLAAVVQLGLGGLAGVGVPRLDRVAQVAARLQLGELEAGAHLVGAGRPGAAGPGGEDPHRGHAGLLGGEVVEPLGEQLVAQRLAAGQRGGECRGAALGEQVGRVQAVGEAGVAGVEAVRGEHPEVAFGGDLAGEVGVGGHDRVAADAAASWEACSSVSDVPSGATPR